MRFRGEFLTCSRVGLHQYEADDDRLLPRLHKQSMSSLSPSPVYENHADARHSYPVCSSPRLQRKQNVNVRVDDTVAAFAAVHITSNSRLRPAFTAIVPADLHEDGWSSGYPWGVAEPFMAK